MRLKLFLVFGGPGGERTRAGRNSRGQDRVRQFADRAFLESGERSRIAVEIAVED